MIKYTNTECTCRVYTDGEGWRTCGAPTWVTDNGVRVLTPYCEQHARENSDARLRDLEAGMGD